jgi:triacylglycerol esterase/lipase EstA (alpha/beta hydrolase family)
MDYLKVEGHSNLVRDNRTKAILNLDMDEYNNYQRLKKIKEKEINRVKQLESDVSGMKNDLDEIKNLLRSLVNGPE